MFSLSIALTQKNVSSDHQTSLDRFACRNEFPNRACFISVHAQPDLRNKLWQNELLIRNLIL